MGDGEERLVRRGYPSYGSEGLSRVKFRVVGDGRDRFGLGGVEGIGTVRCGYPR